MIYETDKWDFIPAKWQKPGYKRTVLWIVIHATDGLEIEGGARAVAHYFQNPPRPGSSHTVTDDVETVQCVYDADIAAGAVGANTHGIHLEQVGYADQTPLQWDDPYSRATIQNTADVAAQYALKFGIPIVRLTVAQLKAGEKGIVGHVDVDHAWPSTGHTDPGPNYNWMEFLAAVQTQYDKRKAILISGGT